MFRSSRKLSSVLGHNIIFKSLTLFLIFAVCIEAVDYRTIPSEYKLPKTKQSAALQKIRNSKKIILEQRSQQPDSLNEISQNGDATWDLHAAADGGEGEAAPAKKPWYIKRLINNWGKQIRSKTQAVVGAPKYIATRYHKSVGKFLGLKGWGWSPPKKVKTTGWSKPKTTGWSKPKSIGWSKPKTVGWSKPVGWSNSPIVWVDGKGEHSQTQNSYEYDPNSYGWSAEDGY